MLCGFGILDDLCGSLTYTQNTGSVEVGKLSNEEKELILWRTGLEDTENLYICYHHQHVILKRFAMNQKKCCDPFKKHKKPAKGVFLYFYFIDKV